MTETPKKILLKDYQAPLFQVEQLHLRFDLHEEYAIVESKMSLRGSYPSTVTLDGENLELLEIRVNEKVLKPQEYQLTDHQLQFSAPHESFEVQIKVRIKPQDNTSLEGLYKSSGIFSSQCEAQGFRKITYFFDRPDVMTSYTVEIEADLKKYPILLSNGNRLQATHLEKGRHKVLWQDPFKKPCYLFALVAGDLGVLKDHFVTRSGRRVELEIYAAHGQQNRCRHAMQSLKKSMRWDEERFDREYDLDTYMILAIDDFNAGAMENKGLNIFNSRLILADPETATDADYFAIESVVAHEYFHNWTGNRVTLRDWFHLSLKEGLTVFRDQEFSMDQLSRGQIRIENVQDLRDYQFSEDSGPNAHPIRPSSCFAVDNFFTSTIYEKGSEVIRMMQTLVGRPGFKKGMDLYFQRHDGQAVIIEDFAQCIAEANGQNWQQFKLWYSQAGTPSVKVKTQFDQKLGIFKLQLEQSCELTNLEKNESFDKKPFHIPLLFELLDENGSEINLQHSLVSTNSENQKMLELKDSQMNLVFEGI
jgi:aminopeptidase N